MIIASRRKFLSTLGKGAVTVPFGSVLLRSAQAADMPKLPVDDPQALALQYVEQSAKGDQKCDGCQLYAAGESDGWGTCSIFPGKLVAGEGWCVSWVKKVG